MSSAVNVECPIAVLCSAKRPCVVPPGLTGHERWCEIGSCGIPQQIEGRAEQLVFELVRSTLVSNHYTDTSFRPQNPQLSVSKQLPIWCQRRNCLARGGPCLCRGSGLGIKKDKLVQCKQAGKAHKNSPVDPYIETLHSVATIVLAVELGP